VLSIFWPRCTTAGAVTSMAAGTLLTLLLIALSPTVQVDLLGGASAWFPLKNPALVTIPLSFAIGIAVSVAWPERRAAELFVAMQRQMHFGDDSDAA
jgi:cation/acetate symporter